MSEPSTPATTPAPDRIVSSDFARAPAVFGMVIVNFNVVMAYDDDGPAWLEVFVGALEGRAAATFVILAGVGTSLMTRRERANADRAGARRRRRTLWRRALFLLVLGYAFMPLWPGDTSTTTRSTWRSVRSSCSPATARSG